MIKIKLVIKINYLLYLNYTINHLKTKEKRPYLGLLIY